MKKSITILSAAIATLSLAAFGWMNSNTAMSVHENSELKQRGSMDIEVPTIPAEQAEVELFYDLASRFMRTVTKGELDMAESFLDIVPEDPKRTIVSYYSVSVTLLDDYYGTIISETADSKELSAAQINILRSVDYSTNILFKAEYKEKNRETGELEDSYTTPHLTVVPEKQAVHNLGKDALIAYVKENTKKFAGIVEDDKLQPGKVTFTVSKAGNVTDAKLTSTSGYPAFDDKMLELVGSMPGAWEPAKNSVGEKVDQKLVFSFGIIGC